MTRCLFEKTSLRGDARYRFEAGSDRCRLLIENRFRGDTDFTEFMHGDYTRAT